MSTTLAREEASGRTTRATPSFDVRVTRVHYEDARGNYSGEVVFHAFPIPWYQAEWFNTLIPRIDSQGRRYMVEVKEVE